MSMSEEERVKSDPDTLETAMRCVRDVLEKGGDGPVTIYSGWLRAVHEAAKITREPDRLIKYKPHPMSGAWRARKIRYGSYAIETELPCINGLTAWFSIGTIHDADEAERMMTDGARLEARDYAEAIAAALSTSTALREMREALERIALVPYSLPASSPEEILEAIAGIARAAIEKATKP